MRTSNHSRPPGPGQAALCACYGCTRQFISFTLFCHLSCKVPTPPNLQTVHTFHEIVCSAAHRAGFRQSNQAKQTGKATNQTVYQLDFIGSHVLLRRLLDGRRAMSAWQSRPTCMGVVGAQGTQVLQFKQCGSLRCRRMPKWLHGAWSMPSTKLLMPWIPSSILAEPGVLEQVRKERRCEAGRIGGQGGRQLYSRQ